MLIDFTLNGKAQSLDVPAYKRLSDLLREDFNLFGVKTGCRKGYCGLCTALLDDKLVYTCLIPTFMVKGRTIVTIEGYSKTAEFEDIARGFKQAGVQLCDYCSPSRTLLTGAMLSHIQRPDEEQLKEILTGVNCTCTPYETLKSGIMFAAMSRQRRLK